jgi:translation initiation factor 1
MGGIVYSTQHGAMCPECGKPTASCRCAARERTGVPDDGVVRVGRETKGRKGKGVTIVTGVPLQGDELKKLAKQLKQRCGSGGAVRDGVIEIQGDHRDTLVAELAKRGWTVKRSGG